MDTTKSSNCILLWRLFEEKCSTKEQDDERHANHNLKLIAVMHTPGVQINNSDDVDANGDTKKQDLPVAPISVSKNEMLSRMCSLR